MLTPQPPGPGQSTNVAFLLQRRSRPRLFLVTWDNSRARTRDPGKNRKQEAFGTVYPNGLVTLDNGTVFAMMGELHHTLDLKGTYEIVYLDEMIEQALSPEERQ